MKEPLSDITPGYPLQREPEQDRLGRDDIWAAEVQRNCKLRPNDSIV